MKNLQLLSTKFTNTEVKNGRFISFYDMNQFLFIATKDSIYSYAVSSKKVVFCRFVGPLYAGQ